MHIVHDTQRTPEKDLNYCFWFCTQWMKNSKYLLKLLTMSLFIVSFVILKLIIKYSNLNKRQWKVSRRRVKNQRIGWCNKLTNVAFKLQHKWHRKSPKKVMKLPIFYCVLVWVIWLRVSNWLHGNWCCQVTPHPPPAHTHTHAGVAHFLV